jgi:hypothetical protein
MPKLSHKTIIEQYDFMNLVEELTYYMWERFLEENADHRDEYVVYDLDNGDTFTSKGEDVFAGIEEDVEKIITTRLQLEFDRTKLEWRSKESLLELPF